MTNTAEVETTDEAQTENAPFAEMKQVDRCYFPPSEVAGAGQTYLNRIAAIPGIMGTEEKGYKDSLLKTNYDVESFDFGEHPTYGLAVIPVGVRLEGENKGTEIKSIVIAAIPDPASVLADSAGREFVLDNISTAFMTKLANAVRPKDGIQPKLPFTLTEFITITRGRESLKSYAELAPSMVTSLKERGLKHITVPILRQCLRSQAEANMRFGDAVTAPAWENVIKAFISGAERKGLDSAIFHRWLETREQAVDEIEIDGDFSDLDFNPAE
jgi:hypothetical protein